MIQKPPPSSGTVLLDASVILMSPSQLGQSTGTTLECILSTNDDLMTESFLASQLRTVAITSSVYPGFVSIVSNSGKAQFNLMCDFRDSWWQQTYQVNSLFVVMRACSELRKQ